MIFGDFNDLIWRSLQPYWNLEASWEEIRKRNRSKNTAEYLRLYSTALDRNVIHCETIGYNTYLAYTVTSDSKHNYGAIRRHAQ